MGKPDFRINHYSQPNSTKGETSAKNYTGKLTDFLPRVRILKIDWIAVDPTGK